jgi:hypothetical protein
LLEASVGPRKTAGLTDAPAPATARVRGRLLPQPGRSTWLAPKVRPAPAPRPVARRARRSPAPSAARRQPAPRRAEKSAR